jgi:hypothetical protein
VCRQVRREYAPSGHDTTELATNSSSILVILVGLAKSKVSKPRSIEGRESSRGCLPVPSDLRKTADSVNLMVNEFLFVSSVIPDWRYLWFGLRTGD